MPCSHPLVAINKGKDENGKNIVQVISRIDDISSIEEARAKYERFGHQVMLLPCGKCPGCLKKRRKAWAARCQAEASYHVDNCFVTLTYDDAFLPSKPVKEHRIEFIKALRNRGYKCRFFGCSERGSKTGRLHWHIILFGFIPDDLKPSHKSDSGFWCYTSKLLTDIWKKGLVVVSQFSPETAAYVAGYVDKKLTNPDDDSFVFMSTHPGIGRKYVEDNLGRLYEYDNIIISFGSHKMGLPRYFDKVAESNGLVLDSLKNKRIAAAERMINQNMRSYDVNNMNDYLARVFDDEIAQMRQRKRGL